MTDAHENLSSADPARHDPSEARPDSCACCGRTHQLDLVGEFVAMLREAAQQNMELARLVVADAQEEVVQRSAAREAAAAEPGSVAADPAAAKPASRPRSTMNSTALAHHRITRSMRMTMSLAMTFQEGRVAREAKLADSETGKERARKNRLKAQVERQVGRAIRRKAELEFERLAETDDEIEFDEEELADNPLYDALAERLQDPDIERDLDRCSRGELVGRVCQDLGLEPDWAGWSTESWAIEEARLKVPGSPYAAERVPETAEPAPEEPVPQEAKSEVSKPEAAKPDVPAAQPIRVFDPRRPPTPEELQRANEVHAAYLRSGYRNSS
jgi:hypothetical protein